MSKYKTVEEELSSFKKPFYLIAGIGVIANILLVVFFGYINSIEKNKKYSTMEVCLYGMESIFSNNANEDLLNESVLKDTEKIRFEIEEITLIKVINDYLCDVVVKDPKGYRSYIVRLEKSSKNPYFYKIFNVKGQKFVSTYQWRSW